MLKLIPAEAIIWVTGLILLATLDTGGNHLSLCPLKNAGYEFCPGCGLGTSISRVFHGEFYASLQAHPLGIFAVVILSFRIVNLTKLYFRNYGKSYRSSS